MTGSDQQQPTTRVQIGIVEDDVVLGEHLAKMVSAVDDFDMVGLATSFAEGALLIDRKPDLMLVDLALPDGSGLDLISRVREHHAACKVLVISIFGDVRNVVRAIECGADGYLLKGAEVEQAENAIRSVLAGGAPISPAVAGHILARLRTDARGPSAPTDARGKVSLSAKELEVLTVLARGLSFKEVAQAQGISHHTVADYVKSIYRKLAVNSRGEAVFKATKTGLIKLHD